MRAGTIPISTPPTKRWPCITAWAWYRRVPTGLEIRPGWKWACRLVERRIIAALRHRKFFRLEEVNRAVRDLLERLNQRPFRKREGSRASVFAALERSALRPLPA